MSIKQVKDFFASIGEPDKVIELTESSATVEMAAQAIGCKPEQIAKTMSFYILGLPILVVTAGDAKIDNRKYREEFKTKARMIPWDEVENNIGHAPGGVCPFAVNRNIEIFLDTSLKRFEYVYPAGGDSNSAVKVTIQELEEHSNYTRWVDVSKF